MIAWFRGSGMRWFTKAGERSKRAVQWAIPCGTARGVLAAFMRGIAYYAAGDGHTTPPPPNVMERALREAGVVGDDVILVRMQQAAGPVVDLGREFEQLQERAFVIAREVCIDLAKSAEGEDWVMVLAHVIGIAEKTDQPLAERVSNQTEIDAFWDAAKKRGQQIWPDVNAAAWLQMRRALLEAIDEARRVARMVARRMVTLHLDQPR